MASVKTTHPRYDELLPSWKKCADAEVGERAIHAAGVTYLPMLVEETSEEYKKRVGRTPFFNCFWRTISGLVGMIYRKPATIELPTSANNLVEDVDMAGTSLNSFSQKVTEHVLTYGRAGILVDHPQMPRNEDGTPITMAQASKLGMRPMLSFYPATSIINWKTGRVNNKLVLTLVVLTEQAAVGEDKYGHKTETRYRVLELDNGIYKQSLWRINDKGEDEQVGEDIFPIMNNRLLTEIPFVIASADGDFYPDDPPLMDLLDMNLHHYQVSADWEHACHLAGLPTFCVSGYMPPEESSQKIGVGGTSALCFPDSQTRAYYAEASSAFSSPLTANLQSKKDEMAVLGARMLEGQKTAVESAETLKQRSAGEASALAGIANMISHAIQMALTIFSEWAGPFGNVVYKLNTDFGIEGLSSDQLLALVDAWQRGAISRQTLHDNLQAGEVIAPDVTVEEEQERINSNPASLTEPLKAAVEDGKAPDSEIDNESIAEVIAAAIAKIPAPVVNVAAPVVNIPAQDAPVITVNMPEIRQPEITVNNPAITVQPAAVTVNNVEGSKDIQIEYDEQGNVIGGTVKPV